MQELVCAAYSAYSEKKFNKQLCGALSSDPAPAPKREKRKRKKKRRKRRRHPPGDSPPFFVFFFSNRSCTVSREACRTCADYETTFVFILFAEFPICRIEICFYPPHAPTHPPTLSFLLSLSAPYHAAAANLYERTVSALAGVMRPGPGVAQQVRNGAVQCMLAIVQSLRTWHAKVWPAIL